MNEEQIAQLLQEVVRIPSVNPHGDPGTDARHTGEGRLAAYLAEVFRKLGLDVECHEVEPGRPNVIAKFTSRGRRRSLALAPHMDTVSVAGMTIDPFAAEIREGRLYGRGATDTKGSLTALLAGLTNALQHKSFRAGDLDVYFCALMGEESGNDGARALMQRGFKADFAIAGEPTDGRIVYAHKGAFWLRMTTRGRSVHGSMPERGESAIKKMSEVVRHLLGDYTQVLKLKADPALGAPTVNVGIIRGGAQTNIVPDHCVIEVDRRTLPVESHAAVLAELREHFSHLPLEIEVMRDCGPLHTDPAHPLIHTLGQAIGTGRRALTVAPWFCDASLFAAGGVPAVAFGPGNIDQAHTADEFIEVAAVTQCAAITERFLLAAATG